MRVTERVAVEADAREDSPVGRDPAFAAQQQRDRYGGSVGEINRWIDGLRDADGRGWMPHIAPIHAGTNAKALSVLSDPGPATKDCVGSGFLCIENDDQTAETQAHAFAEVGLAAADVLPWNAYPWYSGGTPLKAADKNAGADVLRRLIGMLPDLHVVLLQGGNAKDCWQRVEKADPGLVRRRGLTVLETYHPSRQALWHSDEAERMRRQQHRVDTYRQVSDALARLHTTTEGD
ncbi:uracil-DNA glycosylase [Tomitella gaofuii]|uniref:uracil-DNA glycosylase n=1 Tax=Tomitella gaofuii TaxID=2760083 RepID=UPI001C713EB5|nr:uracil-DNA glycosylase [Tomitella gaofuii]